MGQVISRHGHYEVQRRIGNVHTLPFIVVDRQTNQMVGFKRTRDEATRLARFKDFQDRKPKRSRKKRKRA